MSIFDLINPFSYITPIHADNEEVEEIPKGATENAASDPVVESDEFVVVEAEPETADNEEEEAEEKEADEDEEEEEEDPEDPAPAIKEACADTLSCKSLKHHLEECATRVENGSKESCAEELLHLMHCVDQCAVPQIFAKLK